MSSTFDESKLPKKERAISKVMPIKLSPIKVE